MSCPRRAAKRGAAPQKNCLSSQGKKRARKKSKNDKAIFLLGSVPINRMADLRLGPQTKISFPRIFHFLSTCQTCSAGFAKVLISDNVVYSLGRSQGIQIGSLIIREGRNGTYAHGREIMIRYKLILDQSKSSSWLTRAVVLWRSMT